MVPGLATCDNPRGASVEPAHKSKPGVSSAPVLKILRLVSGAAVAKSASDDRSPPTVSDVKGGGAIFLTIALSLPETLTPFSCCGSTW